VGRVEVKRIQENPEGSPWLPWVSEIRRWQENI
jgi:hypothetical protein